MKEQFLTKDYRPLFRPLINHMAVTSKTQFFIISLQLCQLPCCSAHIINSALGHFLLITALIFFYNCFLLSFKHSQITLVRKSTLLYILKSKFATLLSSTTSLVSSRVSNTTWPLSSTSQKAFITFLIPRMYDSDWHIKNIQFVKWRSEWMNEIMNP